MSDRVASRPLLTRSALGQLH